MSGTDEAKAAWSEADDGMLTWCCGCGEDTRIKLCDKCSEELCYNCFIGEDHVLWCFEEYDDDDEDY